MTTNAHSYDRCTPNPHGGNPVLARINAVFFHLVDGYMHWKYADLKSRLFADLPPVVVEIGAGTGANMRYFRPGTKVIAAEPNQYMHAKLAARARRRGIELEMHSYGAERLPLPAGSVEAVVASLVLCTVPDPRAVVREVLRVLKPGGRFVCIEHVAAPPTTFIGAVQRAVFRPWHWFFEGCHTHRKTGRLLEDAGSRRSRSGPSRGEAFFCPSARRSPQCASSNALPRRFRNDQNSERHRARVLVLRLRWRADLGRLTRSRAR
jgi:ubiquinone/menaquinone biosynthesis C-methylase UbiE